MSQNTPSSAPSGATSSPAATPKILAVGYDNAALISLTAALGCQVVQTPRGPQSIWQNLSLDSTAPCLLTEYGVISIHGTDAVGFLQGQTTNDVAALTIDHVQLTGLCTPKGRLLASGWLWRQSHEQFYWFTARALAAGLAKRLSIFVMRSKVAVVDQTSQTSVIGFFDSAPALLTLGSGVIPNSSRGFALLPLEQIVSVQANLSSTTWQSSEAWFLADCQAGLPWVVPNTSELFVPQMLNFDLRDGVSFKKGCYPGQEVVARSHYLGKAKRRMVLGFVVGPHPGQIGDDINSQEATGTPKPVGQLVHYACLNASASEWAVLVECQIAAVLSSIEGQAQLTLNGLPLRVASLEQSPNQLLALA